MLSIDPIVRVAVYATAGTVSPESFDTGLILSGSNASTVTEEDRLRTFTSAADLLTAGFSSSSEAYTAAVKYFAANPAPAQVMVSVYPSGETPAEALDVVLERTSGFYGIYLCNHTAATVQAFAEHLQQLNGHYMFFYSVTGTVADATSASGLFSQLKADGNSRALGLYAANANDAAAVMGLAMGLALARRDTAFALCYKNLNGVETTPLTESQVTSLKALNGNVYVARGYTRNLLENGATASGRRYDEVMYIDRIASELQEAAVALLADNAGKLPQTDETSAVFINRFSAILSEYTAMDVLATSIWRGAPVGNLNYGDIVENGYALWADPYDSQSDSDRAAHKAMPIHAAICLAGSVESLVIDIHVTT